MKPIRHRLFMAAAATLTLGFAATTANAAGLFTLKSKTFADGKMMPKKVANSAANSNNNPSCVGENVSPELHWSNVPDGTKSLVLLMFDPEGRAPSGVSHWVAYGIDPSKVTGFAEGATTKDSDQVCRGQEHAGCRTLFRSLHSAGPDTSSLYIHPHRYGLCSRRVAPWPDAGGTDCEVRAASGSFKGRDRPYRPFRESRGTTERGSLTA